ncbi:MAG: biotin transporter BioY [Cyanobacteria bacterium]|nr:biotin transporter BioY [Cyanobacteriota bacterium]
MFSPLELLWALIGLVLTIGATWLEAFVVFIDTPWTSDAVSLQLYSLKVSFQVGAVLLTACLGGARAGAMAQIAYLTLGLFLLPTVGLPVFTQGGGLDYVREPSFGYLLGFIPGAWMCGRLAFQESPKLETLAYSCLWGLGIIHVCGLVYLVIASLGGWLKAGIEPFWTLVLAYTVLPLPGQLIGICAVAVMAFGTRRLLFY